MGVDFRTETEVDIDKLTSDPKYQDYNLYLDARGLVAKPFDNKFPKTNVEQGGNHLLAMDFLAYCNKYSADKKEGIEKSEGDHPFKKFKLGKRVVLLGSADTAKDVKDTITKLNNEFPAKDPRKIELVTINRQPQESDRAKPGSSYPMSRDKSYVPFKDDDSHNDNTNPDKFIVDGNGKITAVQCQQTYSVVQAFARVFRGKSRQIGEKTYECDSVITAIGFRAPPLIEGEMEKFGEIKDKAIVPIGDVATKVGFVKEGNELIVSAQAIAKKVVDAFLGKSDPKTSPMPQFGSVPLQLAQIARG